MLKKIVILFLLAGGCAVLLKAQPQPPFFRTAEEEAEKQTEMMQHELELTREQRDTIYQINLKYAKARRVSNTRAEMLARINQKTEELKRVLTKEQYHQYMNCQLGDGNRRMVPVLRKQPSPVDSGGIISGSTPQA